MNWNQVPMNLPQHPTKAHSLGTYFRRAFAINFILCGILALVFIYGVTPALNGSDPTPIDRPNVTMDWK